MGVTTMVIEAKKCDCGATAKVVADRWPSWVQLAPHAQPRTGLLCSPLRLQRKS